MTKFHVYRAKIVDFLLMANFGTYVIFLNQSLGRKNREIQTWGNRVSRINVEGKSYTDSILRTVLFSKIIIEEQDVRMSSFDILETIS